MTLNVESINILDLELLENLIRTNVAYVICCILGIIIGALGVKIYGFLTIRLDNDQKKKTKEIREKPSTVSWKHVSLYPPILRKVHCRTIGSGSKAHRRDYGRK